MKYFWNLILSYVKWWRSSPRKLGGGEMLRGYGRVNFWMRSRSELRRDICECAARGLDIYHIELSGWAETNALESDTVIKKRIKDYKFALSLCRRLGLWLFVSIVNDNVGTHKYGDTGRKLSVDAVFDRALQLGFAVKKSGRENVIVQGVAETQTSGGADFEAWTRINFGGDWKTVYNGSSRNKEGEGTHGFTFRAAHPGKIANASKCGRGAAVVSDNGVIIRELGAPVAPHDVDSNAEKIAAFFAAARAGGAPFCVFYDFMRRSVSKKNIKAISKG